MRRRYVPLGWPRRDPRHHRFPIPNTVWEYELRPVEFMIFSYLCYHHSHSQVDAPTLEMIAKGVHLSMNAAKKYLASLADKGLISEDGTSTLECEAGKFFTLPNEVFLLNLPPSAFMVYAYLLLIENRRTHTCHPSYNTIAAASGMSKNTAIKGISALLEMGLITMEHSQYFDKRGMKWNGNNFYTILPVKAAVDLFHQRQLRQLELDTERRRACKRQEEYNRRRPRAALCAQASAQTEQNPTQLCKPLCAR